MRVIHVVSVIMLATAVLTGCTTKDSPPNGQPATETSGLPTGCAETVTPPEGTAVEMVETTELEAKFTLDVRGWCTPKPSEDCTTWTDDFPTVLTVTDQKLEVTEPARGEAAARVKIDLTVANNSLKWAVYVTVGLTFTLDGEDVTGDFSFDHFAVLAAREMIPVEPIEETIHASASACFIGEDVKMTATLTAQRWCT